MAHHRTSILLGSFLALVFSVCLATGAERDPAEVLKRVTAKVVDAGKRIPNYTCVETVTRDFYRPAATSLLRACPVALEQRRHPTPDKTLRLALTDRLRLDVAMTQRGEIFSWVGASRFDDEDVGHLVHEGPMGSGAFGAFLTLVFQEDLAAFRFESNAVADGRSLLEYSFQVRREDSHYKVKLKDGSWVFTAYSGRFRVDPETEDVIRLSVETAELPAASNQCMIETAMELGIQRIAGASVPLPAHTRQRFVYGDGEETENTTTFANCHEYRGESTILYDEEPAGPAPGHTPGETPAAARVPAGLRFTMELTAPIPAATAAAGDVFAGKLVWPLLDAKHKVLARAGSVLEGRLLRVHSYYLPEAEVVLALKLDSVEIGGSKMPLTATRDFTSAVEEKIRGRRAMPIVLPRPLPGEEHAGLFRFAGKSVVVGKGFRSEWRTQ